MAPRCTGRLVSPLPPAVLSCTHSVGLQSTAAPTTATSLLALLLSQVLLCVLQLFSTFPAVHAAANDCPNATDVNGTVTIGDCVLSGSSYTIDVASLLSPLYDGGSRPTAFVVNIGHLQTSAGAGDPVVLHLTNASSFTFTDIPVNISLGSFVAGGGTSSLHGSVVVDVVLPVSTSTVEFGRIDVWSSSSISTLSCGYTAFCVSTNTISSSRRFVVRNLTMVLDGQAAATPTGTTWAGVRIVTPGAISHWYIYGSTLAFLQVTFNATMDTMDGSVWVVQFPSVPTTLDQGSSLVVDGNCSKAHPSCGSVFVKTSQNLSTAVVVGFRDVTVASGRIDVLNLNFTLELASDATTSYVQTRLEFVHFDHLEMISSNSHVQIATAAFVDPQSSVSASVAGRTIINTTLSLLSVQQLSMNESSTFDIRGCIVDVTWMHRMSLIHLLSLRETTLVHSAGGSPSITVENNTLLSRLQGDKARSASLVNIQQRIATPACGARISVSHNLVVLKVFGPPIPVTTVATVRVVHFSSPWEFSGATLTIHNNQLRAADMDAPKNQFYILKASDTVVLRNASLLDVADTVVSTEAASGMVTVLALALAAFDNNLTLETSSSIVLSGTSIAASAEAAGAQIVALLAEGNATHVGEDSGITIEGLSLDVTVGTQNITSAALAVFKNTLEMFANASGLLIRNTTSTIAASNGRVQQLGLTVGSLSIVGTTLLNKTLIALQDANWSASFTLRDTVDQGLVMIGGSIGNGSLTSIHIASSRLSLNVTSGPSATSAVAVFHFKSLGGVAARDIIPSLTVEEVYADIASYGSSSACSTSVLRLHFVPIDGTISGVSIANSVLRVRTAVGESSAVVMKGGGKITVWTISVRASNVSAATAGNKLCAGILIHPPLLFMAPSTGASGPTRFSIDQSNVSAVSAHFGVPEGTVAVRFNDEVECRGAFAIHDSIMRAIGSGMLYGLHANARMAFVLDSRWVASQHGTFIEGVSITTDRPAGEVTSFAIEAFNLRFDTVDLDPGIGIKLTNCVLLILSSFGAASPGQMYYNAYVEEFRSLGTFDWGGTNTIALINNTVGIDVNTSRIGTCIAFSMGGYAAGSSGAYRYQFTGNMVDITCVSTYFLSMTVGALEWFHNFGRANSSLIFNDNTVVLNGGDSPSTSLTGLFTEYISDASALPSGISLQKTWEVKNNTVTMLRGTDSFSGVEIYFPEVGPFEDHAVTVTNNVIRAVSQPVAAPSGLQSHSGIAVNFIPIRTNSPQTIFNNRFVVNCSGAASVLSGFVMEFVKSTTAPIGHGQHVVVTHNTLLIHNVTDYSGAALSGIWGVLPSNAHFASTWIFEHNNFTNTMRQLGSMYINAFYMDTSTVWTIGSGGSVTVQDNHLEGWECDGIVGVPHHDDDAVLFFVSHDVMLAKSGALLFHRNTIARGGTFIGAIGQVSLTGTSVFSVNDNIITNSGGMGCLVSVDDVNIATLCTLQCSGNEVSGTNVDQVVDVNGDVTIGTLGSFDVSNNIVSSTAKVKSTVVSIGGYVTVQERGAFLIGGNTVHLTGSASNMMLYIAQTATLASRSVFAVRNNKGYFPTNPASHRQPFMSVVSVTITTPLDGGGFLLGGNVWNASTGGGAVAKLITSTNGLVYTSTHLNNLKFGCNSVSSANITNYADGTSVPTSFISQLPAGASPVVPCGVCSVYLDCYSFNTKSVFLASDGRCICICRQTPLSAASGLPCAPPVLAFTASRSMVVSGSAGSSTRSSSPSGTLTESPTSSYTSSMFASTSATQSKTPSSSDSGSISASTSSTQSETPSSSDSGSISGSPSRTHSQTRPNSLSSTVAVTGTRQRTPTIFSNSSSFSDSSSWRHSTSMTSLVSNSFERTRTKAKSPSATHNHSPSKSTVVTPSHVLTLSAPSLSASSEHSTSLTVTHTLSDTPRTKTKSHSINPCAMQRANNLSDVFHSTNATKGLDMLALSSQAGFSWTGAVSYEVLAAAPAAVNITLDKTFKLRLALPPPNAPNRERASSEAVLWASSSQASSVTVVALTDAIIQVRLAPVNYNKFVTRRTTITILSTTFLCAAKLQDITITIVVTPYPVTISAATVQTMTSVAASLSVATANPTAGVAASRVSMLRNLLECTVDLTEDNGNSFTGFYFGPESGQYSRGAVVGNVIFFVFVGGIGVVLAALVALYGKLRHHKPFVEGLVLVCDTLHYPSVLMIPLAVVLQPTLTESITLIVVEPAVGDWVIGICGICCMATIVLPFTYVLLFDFRCVLAKRTEVDRAKREKKIQSSIGWAVGPMDDPFMPSIAEEGVVSSKEMAQMSNAEKKSMVHRIVRAVFEEDSHWVVEDPTKTSASWKRRFLFLFADYRLRWFCLADLWISVILGAIAGVNLGLRNVCMFQLSSIVFGYTFLLLSCIFFRPAFGRFASGYVVVVNGLGVVGASSTLVASWNANEDAISLSSVSALLISGISMIKTFPDLFLLAVALPSIVMSVLHPFRDAAQLHDFLKVKDIEMNARHNELLDKAKLENSKNGDDDEGASSWSPRPLNGDGGEDIDSETRQRRFGLLLRDGERRDESSDDDARTANPSHKKSSSTYVFHRRIVLDMLDSALFDCSVLVHQMVTDAMPLCAKDMRILARSIVEDAMTGGVARLAASYAMHKVLLPHVLRTIEVRDIVTAMVKRAIMDSERALLGTQGIEDLIGSVHQINEGQTLFMTSSDMHHDESGPSFLGGLQRSAMGALGSATGKSKRPEIRGVSTKTTSAKQKVHQAKASTNRRKAKGRSSSSSSSSSSASSSSDDSFSSADL